MARSASLTAAEYLRAAERLPLVGLDGVIPAGGPGDGAVVLAPHPDDESLGCGGLLAALATAGRPARVIVMSDGAGSHPGSRTHPAPVLRALRREEARAACAILGVPPPIFLEYPDGDVPVSGPHLDEAVERVVAASTGIGTLVATITLDPHKDHVATWAVARAAAARAGMRLLGYPVWSWRYAYPAMGEGLGPMPDAALPAPPRGVRLDVAPWLATKRRAAMAHASQTSGLIADDPGGFVLREPVLSVLLRPFEVYLEYP